METSSINHPLLDRKVGDLVADRPGRSRVFQSYKIDFCCQGVRSLREACQRQKIDIESILKDLEAEESETTGSGGPNPAKFPPALLCDYIVEIHHNHLRRELPRIREMALKVARVHGPHTPSLIDVAECYVEMADDILKHIDAEEKIAFPTIRALARGEGLPEDFDTPLDLLFKEHDETGAALEHLRSLTNDFLPPPEACNTYRALFAGLLELETDLHTHIHLENSVLFPAARKLMEEKS